MLINIFVISVLIGPLPISSLAVNSKRKHNIAQIAENERNTSQMGDFPRFSDYNITNFF